MRARSFWNSYSFVAFGVGCWGCALNSPATGGSGGDPGTSGGATGTAGATTGAAGAATGAAGAATGAAGAATGAAGAAGAATGGATGAAGATGFGGATGSAGASTGGAAGSSGAATGGGVGSGGAMSTGMLPCDIYAADGGPCKAAHSTVRALYAAYNGPLYQVNKGGMTKDIPPIAPGGLADSSVQDTFCGATACTISIIYDQSGNKNDLTKTLPGGSAKPGGDNEADAKALPITLNGKKVYGEHNPAGVGYRNNTPTGTAKGDSPETEYMITSGDYMNGQCCFDYGNMETNTHDNGEGTMEAIYFGNCTIWGKGNGSGPWVMGDLENGLWAGNTSPYAMNTPVNFKYVTAMLKGDKAGMNHWAIKAGNAASGKLTKMFDGVRPSSRYNPMRKEGAIGLGTGGDNSNGANGNFFEGVMTAAYSSDAADDAVQANVTSVYGP